MGALTVYLVLALGVSFLCSLLEAVILSLSRGHIESVIAQGHQYGHLLKKYKTSIDRPLAAILTLNTVAHTIGASGVGAQVQIIWGNRWVTLASIVLTILILVLSEIIPKTLGAVYCKKLAALAAYFIRAMMWTLFPIVVSLETLSRWLTPQTQSRISREEVKAVAELGQTEGALQHQENRVIQNLLALRNIRVKDILTPRHVMLAFKKDQTIKEVVEKHSPIRFSRIPVYGKDLDDVIGLVNRYKILSCYSEGSEGQGLTSIAREIYAVPDTKSVAATLDVFLQKREQLFLVVDEYGGTEGIITLEDVIETLLGVEIVDELDAVKDMRKLAKQLWEQRQRNHKFHED